MEVRYNLNVELRKFRKGKPTKVVEYSLLRQFATPYKEIRRRKPTKDFAWLEQLYRLEDPRR
jgi:hypothetical protein